VNHKSPILRLAAITLVVLGWSTLAFCGEIHDAAKNGDLENIRARNALKAAIPAYAAKVEKTVAGLQGETPSQSVSNLYYVTDYFNPGVQFNSGISEQNRDQADLEAILSNRRFRKVFSELGKMDKAKASQLVKTNLISALGNYSSLYERHLHSLMPLGKITNSTQLIPITFVTGFTKPEDAGKETIVGEKMKVLSLVWISGMLKLTDNQELVDQVARLALKQKAELDNDPTLESHLKENILWETSLYNRRILSSGLMGVSFKETGMETNAMKAAGVKWEQKTLVGYEAALTEYDKPFFPMGADRSTGTITVNYVSYLTDANFDQLLQEIHFK